MVTVTSFANDFSSQYSIANNSKIDAGSDFVAIDELMRKDADTALFFLSANDISFSSVIDDPFFSAHQSVLLHSDSNSPQNATDSLPTFYQPDHAANVLGCTMQSQYCNPGLPVDRCLPLGSIIKPLSRKDASIFATQRQQDRLLRFFYLLEALPGPKSLLGVIEGLGISALKARDTLQSGIQGRLPNNQWQIELVGWVLTMLAAQQRAFVDYANGPIHAVPDEFLYRPEDDISRSFCHNQVSCAQVLRCITM